MVIFQTTSVAATTEAVHIITDSSYPMSNPKALGKHSQNQKGGKLWQELRKEEEMQARDNSFLSKKQKGAKILLSLRLLKSAQ